MPQAAEHLKDEGSRQQVVIAGAVAGLFSRFCIAPLDVLKIRLQLHPYSPAQAPPTTLTTFRSILRDEGIRAFWKGNLPAELLYLTYATTQFTTYHALSTNPLLLSLPTPLQTFTSGAVAGASATTLTYPLDLLRTRFAAQVLPHPSRYYKSLWSSIVRISREEGIPGFWKGWGAGVLQIVPYMGTFFATYEGLRPGFHALEVPWGGGDAAAGVCAGVVAKTGVFPLDLIRKRLQVVGREGLLGGDNGEGQSALEPRTRKRPGVWSIGKEVVLREGWRGLYRGLGVGLLKAAPASAMTMWGYEVALRGLRKWDAGS